EHVTIYYPWCSRFGLSLPVLRRMRQQQGDSLICETPEGNAFALPAWMADRAVCAAFSLGPPVASVFALRTLRVFLDGLHPDLGARHDLLSLVQSVRIVPACVTTDAATTGRFVDLRNTGRKCLRSSRVDG